MKKESLESLAKKSKKSFYILFMIPIITIVLIIVFRYEFFPTNNEIIDYIKNAKGYISTVEYTIKNNKGTYVENAIINYNSECETKIEFESGITTIYKDDKIIMIDNSGCEYESKSNNDLIYSLSILDNVLQNKDDDKLKINLENIEEKKDEWGEKEYLILEMTVESNNRHVKSIDMFIDKKEKVPFMTKIYDVDKNESAIIVYKCFKYI